MIPKNIREKVSEYLSPQNTTRVKYGAGEELKEIRGYIDRALGDRTTSIDCPECSKTITGVTYI